MAKKPTTENAEGATAPEAPVADAEPAKAPEPAPEVLDDDTKMAIARVERELEQSPGDQELLTQLDRLRGVIP